MSYCPIALMEDIRGSGVDNGDGCGSNSSSSGSSDDSTMISVHFPQLPPNPPTDDSETTTTSSSGATTTTTTSSTTDGQASDDQQQGTQSWHGSLDEGQGSSKRVSHCNDDDAASSGSGSSKLKPPPETIASSQPSSQPSSKRISHSDGHVDTDDDDDDDEMEIDELDFSNSATATSADQIRTALNKLVLTAKRRKKRLKQQQQAVQASSSASVGVGVGGGGGAPTAGKPSKSPPRHDNNNNNNNNEEVRKPSLKQRPIQVIMTWMDSFQDNENIQLSCLQSLPIILEDAPNRLTAQADGLASIVLYNMAAFPSNSLLQLTAFHTLVVLLRPLGANEGMVHKAHVHSGNATSKSSKGIRSINHKKHSSSSHHHHKTSINNARHHHHHPKNMSSPLQQPHQSSSSSITAAVSGGLVDGTYEPRWEENGVRVMLDSLRRFSSDRYLQAMGCWAMVNAALYPSLKASLLRLGGVYTVTNAMMLHPNVEAVQFRGLFALINLVIPDNKNKKDGDGSSIHSHIYQIARLTILAMKNFHTNKSILNRGCLVLRNLSLTPAFVKILARTPGCVDMLLHCRQMCPRDVLVQRSARTIMILVQRVTNKKIEVGVSGSLKMPQSMPLEASMASASASSSFAMPTAMSTSSSSTPAEMAPPKAMMRERE